jgi:hypothetical protein
MGRIGETTHSILITQPIYELALYEYDSIQKVSITRFLDFVHRPVL